MIVRLLLILVVLGFLYWATIRYKSLPVKQRRGWLLKLALYGGAGVLLAAVVSGRVHWLGAVAAGALAMGRFGLRFLPLLRMFNVKGMIGNPVFKTDYLRVSLDINSGTLSGEILEGPHAGTPLEQLSETMVEELLGFYEDKDKRSYYLMRVIKQRQNGPHSQQQDYSSVGNPSQDEAILILGLENTVKERLLTKQDVIVAHRKLIQKLHPDRGGNDYLAARINQAKDILLQGLKQ